MVLFSLAQITNPSKSCWKRFRPDVVAFDPLVSYVGDVDMFKGTEVRRNLDRYIELAVQYNFALIFVIHLNKADTKAVYKIADSMQIVAMAKCVYIVGPNPKIED